VIALKEARALARSAAPDGLLRPARRLRDEVSRRRLAGDAVRCPVCGDSFERFGAFHGRPDARCPGCGALERHRLLWLYLSTRTDLFTRPQQVLHIAPEPFLRPLLQATHGNGYVYGDVADPQHRLDVTALPAADRTFDVILCSHVFEHVPDDHAAVAELRRVLRPGGWAILDAPVDDRRASTDEDLSVTSSRERRRRFGQWDHVRVYGRDYPDLLRSGGFEVVVDPFDAAERDRRTCGLRPGTDHIYLCRRAA
jgi:SAM-dependent methyltransferase